MDVIFFLFVFHAFFLSEIQFRKFLLTILNLLDSFLSCVKSTNKLIKTFLISSKVSF